MFISDEIFRAFLDCETKSYLKFLGQQEQENEYILWRRNRLDTYRQKCKEKLRITHNQTDCLFDTEIPNNLNESNYHLIVNCTVKTQNRIAHIDALEQKVDSKNRGKGSFYPIRFVPNEKVNKFDKLQVAFDALVLSSASDNVSVFGKIMYGSQLKTTKVDLSSLLVTTKSTIRNMATQLSNSEKLRPALNKHCPDCEYQLHCRKLAVEKDDLSLLSGMSAKERRHYNDKGIFSVTQLSYTFRVRRRPKRFATKPENYSHALKALAIRENKVHLIGNLELKLKNNPVFLDVEGIPDQNFYYLIGLRTKENGSYIQYSFWANKRSDEKEIWISFLKTLATLNDPQLIHYGSYETVFLKRMLKRYPDTINNFPSLDQVANEAINLLSIIYAQIYFPTYSNSLKEIAQYLGFRWSDKVAVGLYTIMWRTKWETSKKSSLKQKLLIYNSQDCEALQKVAITIAQLTKKRANSDKNDIVLVDELKRETPHKFGKIDFSLPELDYINQAAYWHYQRDRIYIKSSQTLKRIKKKTPGYTKPSPVNKIIVLEGRPSVCTKCKATKIYKYGRMNKVVYDLKFGRTGVKRWVVKYCFDRYICWGCKTTFYIENRPWTRSKYGMGLQSYVIYQIIELRLAQRAVAESLNQLFKFDLNAGSITRIKKNATQFYKITYETILNKIVTGKLIHADETKMSIIEKDGFVWVLTNMEEVAYFYTETRDGDTIQAMLQDFKGVLVSDFYAVYDSIDCPQQKCLIHLIRDLNGDLLKQPFNAELAALVRNFALLLKPMIDTISRFGLKAYFLKKHKISVDHFYEKLARQNYESELAVSYKRRFEKNRTKLFTFLDYDNIPWNNNNAEHAIKAFARLRNVIGGKSSDKGIQEYLTLLSINTTCKYKGISFLDFLRSGEKDIDVFISKRQ
jgi:predicted RecB family nuclease